MEAKLTAQTTQREIALLLPGMSFNASIFPDLAMRTLAPDFNAALPGPEGGHASREGMDRFRRRLDGFLDAAPWWKAPRRFVIAHSFGGMLALHWLLHHGGNGLGRIDGLLLVATTAGPLFDVARLRLGRVGRREIRVPLKHVMPLWNLPVVTRAVKRATSGGALGARRVDFRRLGNRSDVALDLAGWRNTDWRAMRSYRLALRGFDVRDRLSAIRVPAIVLHGTQDTLLPLALARELADRLPRAELRVVDGAAHGLPLTHGAEVQRALRDLSAT